MIHGRADSVWGPAGAVRLLLALGLLAGCGGEQTDSLPEATVSQAGVELLHSHTEPRYELRIEELVGSGPEDERVLRALVRPRGVWHLSTEYPVRLKLSGAGLGLRQPSQTVDDAVEASADRAEFRTVFVPEAADAGPLAGRLRFGVCRRAEHCVVVNHDFEAPIGAETP